MAWPAIAALIGKIATVAKGATAAKGVAGGAGKSSVFGNGKMSLSMLADKGQGSEQSSSMLNKLGSMAKSAPPVTTSPEFQPLSEIKSSIVPDIRPSSNDVTNAIYNEQIQRMKSLR